MKLKVKVGDKGKYREAGSCEVVYVKPESGYFVTSSIGFIPQVHSDDGTVLRARSFDFIPEPKIVRVAVWLDDDGRPHCCLRELENTAPKYPETIVEFTVPR